jgi:hypothetical protein
MAKNDTRMISGSYSYSYHRIYIKLLLHWWSEANSLKQRTFKIRPIERVGDVLYIDSSKKIDRLSQF